MGDPTAKGRVDEESSVQSGAEPLALEAGVRLKQVSRTDSHESRDSQDS